MKDPFDRTKVVVRHLPPAISQSVLLEQIDGRFAGRYKWFCFRPGKNSQQPCHSRAYIDFNKLEDVLEFAEFFDGHVFVNEKGAQFKAIVEYAPSQRVPKPWSKKDGREGTIFKDPEYLEFLELIAKPAENLPSAEIQLERKEAERAGQPKESPIVTPLMDFVRQKRAAKSGSQRSSSNGKLSRRGSGSSPGSSTSGKRGSEKRRISTSMYVLRDSTKNSNKEKSTYLLVPKREEQLSEKALSVGASETIEDETAPATDRPTSGVSGTVEIGKKKVLLLKGKEREIASTSGSVSQQQRATSHVRNSPGSTGFKQNQRREASGRIIRSILSNKDPRQSQPSTAAGSSEQQPQQSTTDKEKRPPRPTNIRSILKDHISSISSVASSDSDAKKVLNDKALGSESHSYNSVYEKPERRTRNRDRPDRVVWTPLRRSDISQTSDDFVSASSLQLTELLSEPLDMSLSQHIGPSKAGDDVIEDTDNGSYFTGGKPRNIEAGAQNSRAGRSNNLPYEFGEMKAELLIGNRIGDGKNAGSARSGLSSVENGSHRHGGRRGPHGLKDDGLASVSEGKPSKRGAAGYGSHEKQVWVQKSGPGS